MNTSDNRPHVWRAFSFLVIIAGLIIWWVNSMSNEDPLWFLRNFNAQADWIVVYHDGDTSMFFPGDRAYERIMDAFADGVAHWSGYEGGVGLSDENLERFRAEWEILELHFNKPVKVHTRHLYSEARNFFIPLMGTHAEYRRVFAGLTDKPRIGVVNMSADRFAALLQAVAEAVPTVDGK
ncbi:MAG: hypothetical protein P1S60_11320 [Anaerolineae bacterium]|nr:hypothetical protein [Anaerolineae bacterium]